MRLLYEKLITTVAIAAPNRLNGANLNHALREIATVLGGRAADLLGIKLFVRATLNNADTTDPLVPGARDLMRALHGRISLQGPHGTGLVPDPLWGDEVQSVNSVNGVANAIQAGFLGGPAMGPAATRTVPADDSLAVESTLILTYAPRAFQPTAHGDAGQFDGAVDASLFGSSTTLQIDQMFASPIPANADMTVTDARLDVIGVYATCEPGQYLAPLRPQYRRLGLIDADPRVYGLGERSDIQGLIAVAPTPATNIAWILARDTQAQVTIDSVVVHNEPASSLGRATQSQGVAGLTLANCIHGGGWVGINSPSNTPKATERHVGSTIEVSGLLDGAGQQRADLLGFIVQAPGDATKNEWARKRGLDLSKGGFVDRGKTAGGLSAEQALGIAPRFTG